MEKEILVATATRLAPATCPELLENENYLRTFQVIYLGRIIELAKSAGLTNDDIATAWDCVYNEKCNLSSGEENTTVLANSLRELFRHLSAHEMKLHYAARLAFQALFL